MVHAKYTPSSQKFKPAEVVSVDRVRATCTLKFYGHDDYQTMPLTKVRIRPPAPARLEDGKLVRLIYGEVRAAAVHCRGGILISLSLSRRM